VAPGETFEIDAWGQLVGGDDWSVYAYAVYQGATWEYDDNHLVSVSDGDLIDASGFEWGATFEGTYALTAGDGGEETVLFIIGWRDGAHGYYDLAVELSVPVAACERSTDALVEALRALDDDQLRAPAEVHRNALVRQASGAGRLLDEGRIGAALSVLHELRLLVAGPGAWVTDADAQVALLEELEAVVACVEGDP
jgi:hypothetical protein